MKLILKSFYFLSQRSGKEELAAIEDPEERRIQYDAMVAESYENAKALHAASYFGIDDVIDPADSRRWIMAELSTHHAVGVKKTWPPTKSRQFG